MLHHENPVVSMRLLMRAGFASDPKERLGAATRRRASRPGNDRAKQDLADTIDFMGGSMGAGAGTDLTHIDMLVMKTLRKRHADAVDRAQTGVRPGRNRPQEAADAVGRRSASRSEMRRQLVFIGWSMASILRMPDSARGNAGSVRRDLVAFHSKLAPNNAILAPSAM